MWFLFVIRKLQIKKLKNISFNTSIIQFFMVYYILLFNRFRYLKKTERNRQWKYLGLKKKNLI